MKKNSNKLKKTCICTWSMNRNWILYGLEKFFSPKKSLNSKNSSIPFFAVFCWGLTRLGGSQRDIGKIPHGPAGILAGKCISGPLMDWWWAGNFLVRTFQLRPILGRTIIRENSEIDTFGLCRFQWYMAWPNSVYHYRENAIDVGYYT